MRAGGGPGAAPEPTLSLGRDGSPSTSVKLLQQKGVEDHLE